MIVIEAVPDEMYCGTRLKALIAVVALFGTRNENPMCSSGAAPDLLPLVPDPLDGTIEPPPPPPQADSSASPATSVAHASPNERELSEKRIIVR
jgi:hypothetical protein